ncbi:hypothetical protein P389DRAFT_177646 [Cystobasidium minutum MCA 4210]|uniref:uncharacterized protein n=1 Tax=Cystobasidium minutum MCA 4210 TaxID=1397322 RepID=UPI0034CD722E|eukprot:jgi/Rhomi1/177646/fgenesh1_pg.2_\
MSLNDTSVGIGDNKGVDIPAGVANPTESSTYGNPKKDNYVEDPVVTSGLGEAEPTIESTKIEPIGTVDSGGPSFSATSTGTGSESILGQVTKAAQDAVSSLTGNK